MNSLNSLGSKLAFQNQQRRKRSMSETSTLIGYSGRTIDREELALVPTPAATETHRPVPHHEIVQALIETLGVRHIGDVHDAYAGSPDGLQGLRGSRRLNGDDSMRFFRWTAQFPRQEHAFGNDLWLSCVRVLEHGVRGRFYARAREALADRLHLGCRRPNAAQL